MYVLDWARSVKNDLLKLQQETGIPALWAAAQFVHESCVRGGEGLSDLATKCHNYAGLKWRDWQKEYGCSPVNMQTWEVIGGERVDLSDAFCSCPDFATWLKVYSALLLADRYKPALAYAADPMLYGWMVWKSGWATDPNYIASVGNWLTKLYDDYKDTIVEPTRQAVPVEDAGGACVAEGWIQYNRTVVLLRPLLESLGYQVEWVQDGPKVIISKP